MSRKRILVLAYLGLLLASFFVVRAGRAKAQPATNDLVLPLDGGGELAYQVHPLNAPARVLVLGSSEGLEGDHDSGALHVHLERFSNRHEHMDAAAFAERITPLLRAQMADRPFEIHTMGNSAALGIELAAQRPGQVRGLYLWDPRGLRRDEYLGDPMLNRIFLAGATSLSWLLDHGLPHFGLLDRSAISFPHARRAFANDPAANRVRLAELGGKIPVGIDGVALDALSAESIAALSPVEPEGPRSPLRGKRMWLLVLALVFMMSVTEDLTCIGAGLLVWKGVLGYAAAVLGCFLGLVIGDVGLYLIGAIFGPVALRTAPFRWFISADAVERQQRRFKNNMFGLIFSSRFLPGARVPCYVAAGILRTGLPRFTLYLIIAALVWVPFLVGLSALLGATFLEWFEAHKNLALLGVFGLVASLWLLIRKGLPLLSWKGRRLAFSSWQRLRRWEFWPRWAFYPPIFLHIVGLMFRYRSVTLPLITNPGMPNSGFVLDPKSEIFHGLGPSPALPAWAELPSGLPRAEAMTRLERIGYPLVIKPDIGYRGQGIHVVRTPEAAAAALDGFGVDRIDLVGQAEVRGPEFGVFYIREPDAPSGRVPSITRKVIPHLTADGRSTIETLILTDERAVCMALSFLDAFADRLDEVPPAGERIPLAAIGTHSRGAVFLDATKLATPELVRVLDAICIPYEGFHFGRFDLRVPSDEHLRRGEGLQILELNGLTAEATHIYDPKHSLRYGRQTIRDQWTSAFEIAEANRQRGHKPPGLIAFVTLLFKFARADQ